MAISFESRLEYVNYVDYAMTWLQMMVIGAAKQLYLLERAMYLTFRFQGPFIRTQTIQNIDICYKRKSSQTLIYMCKLGYGR